MSSSSMFVNVSFCTATFHLKFCYHFHHLIFQSNDLHLSLLSRCDFYLVCNFFHYQSEECSFLVLFFFFFVLLQVFIFHFLTLSLFPLILPPLFPLCFDHNICFISPSFFVLIIVIICFYLQTV